MIKKAKLVLSELPANCWKCPLPRFDYKTGKLWCPVQPYINDKVSCEPVKASHNKRDSKCPLIEIESEETENK